MIPMPLNPLGSDLRSARRVIRYPAIATMTLRRIFFDPPAPSAAEFRYGFLALTCALLAWSVYLFFTRSPHYHGDPYGSLIIAVMLLLNHVSAHFRLPPRVTVAARILAIVWLAFSLVYVFYLSRLLFPLY